MRFCEFEYNGGTIKVDSPFCDSEELVSRRPIKFDVDQLKTTLTPILNLGKDIFEKAKEFSPTETSIEFGLDIGVESGNLCWGIVKGNASTHFNVTMTWK